MATSGRALFSESYFLELNGYRFTAYEEDAARAVFDLAAGSLAHADYTSFVRANCTPE